jgi:UDP-glucuronate decarboxylase
MVIKLTKSKSILSSKPLPADDPTQRQPDIGLARQMLRWEPTTLLEVGLLKTIAYFNELTKPG